MTSIKKTIGDYLVDRIAGNQYRVNDRIPTEIELAKMFKTSRCHASQAVKELERNGIVRRIKRRGTFVKRALTSEQVYHLRSAGHSLVYVLHSPLSAAPQLHWNIATLRRMESLLSAEGYRVVYRDIPATRLKAFFAKTVSEMEGKGVRALVILPDYSYDKVFLQEETDPLFGFPGDIYILNCGAGSFDEWPFHMVRIDPFEEGLAVAKYLCQRGHNQIVFFQHPVTKGYYWSRQRYRGLMRGIQLFSHGKANLESSESSSGKNCRGLCERIRNARGQLAIVAAYDGAGADLIERAGQMSLHAPVDFQLIAFDNNPAFYRYNLTTVSPPIEKTGEIFAKLINEQVWNKRDGCKITITLGSHIVERQTCR